MVFLALPIVAVVVWLICAFFILPPPRGGLCGMQVSMDIIAGRTRCEKFFLGVKFVNRVSESEISRMYRHVVGPPPSPVWRTSSWAWTSTHGLLEGDTGYVHALAAGEMMASVLGREGLASGEAKRTAIVKYLGLLQDNPDAAIAYGDRVFSLALNWGDTMKRGIGVEDLARFDP